MEYIELKNLAREYRKELIPILKKMGFGASITTQNDSYWGGGSINVLINKVPTNFEIWSDEYKSDYRITANANKLKTTIVSRLKTLVESEDSNIEYSVRFDSNKIKY